VIETDGTRLRFTHPLLASVHYASASPDERARVHRRLAEVVADAEERGRHLGAAATAPDAEVAAAVDEAAAAARARAAPAAAAELGEVALRLTPPTDSAALLRRIRAAADHHYAAGSSARARALLEQALARAARGPERARVALELARQLDVQDRVAERPLLTRALHEAEGDTMLRAEIHLCLASYYSVADYGELQRHARIAFSLAERTGDRRLIAETLAAVSIRLGHEWATKSCLRRQPRHRAREISATPRASRRGDSRRPPPYQSGSGKGGAGTRGFARHGNGASREIPTRRHAAAAALSRHVAADGRRRLTSSLAAGSLSTM